MQANQPPAVHSPYQLPGELAWLNAYSIKPLAKGGMGSVFILCDGIGKNIAVIKLIRSERMLDESARTLFRREMSTSLSLRHDNIVSFQGYGDCGDLSFLLMEHCDGGSVAAHMAAVGGTLPLPEALDITYQALGGLAYAHTTPVLTVGPKDGRLAHAIGIVHRDLKPDNLFRSSAGNGWVVKIADYGLAKAFDTAGSSGITATGQFGGSPWFMPRHQVSNYKYAGPEVDVWAIAASLYNMLTGHYARDFPRDRDPWSIVLNTSPIPIRQRSSAIPKPLAEVIDRALDDSGAELSFTSADSFREALEAVSES
jgi:eukaryotic-like serine/threonine-protein kinase